MTFRCSLIVVLLAWGGVRLSADETLYRYECNAFPTEQGWFGGGCDLTCTPSVEDSHFVLRHDGAGALVGYQLNIAGSDLPPLPPTFWVEWRFRSNHPIGPNFFTCDGDFRVDYDRTSDLVFMYGDAVISFGGDFAVFGLALDEFHTFRFESTDGVSYTIAVDGQVFVDLVDTKSPGGAFLQMGGLGGCDAFPNAVQEWDFVRYGTIATGEQIVASDPPAGFLDPAQFSGIDRFTVTFDSANYVYIDDITVQVSGGIAPTVIQTRRRENTEPDVVEIVLDRPMPTGQTTTFTFTDGTATNVIAYTLAPPPPECGDGTVNQATEECDGSEDTACPGLCRTNCTCGFCGDAILDSGEQCDNGASNSDTLPDACRTNCTLPTCGDNVTDEGEQCDGQSDDACPSDCLPNCTCDIPAIPTLSHWGLLALAALLLTLSKRHFARPTT